MSSISLSVVSDFETLLGIEVEHVKWYLDRKELYEKQGYEYRLPFGIEKGQDISHAELESIIRQELIQNADIRREFEAEFLFTWAFIARHCIPVAEVLYGIPFNKEKSIVPSMYGTGGGPLFNDGDVFVVLPQHRPNVWKRTLIEFLVHEILAHGWTEEARRGTRFDEDISISEEHAVKERLMDLFGKVILVRSGLFEPEEIHEQPFAIEKASEIVDRFFYEDPENPDPYNLKYEGNLLGLIADMEQYYGENQERHIKVENGLASTFNNK